MTTRLSKDFGGAVSSFETPGLGYMASEDEEIEEDQVDVDRSEHPLLWHVKRNLNLENCLKRVDLATPTVF